MHMSVPSVVQSERPMIGTRRYDLGVYRAGETFHATWFCADCPARGKTSPTTDQAKAHADGMSALKAHDKVHGE
jgi:hypothetical protein